MDYDTWRITILLNNCVKEGPFLAEHGLSLKIEGPDLPGGAFVLFDTGQHPDILLHNAEHAGVDWSRLHSVVLSHGHYDHTGGLPGVLSRIDHPVRVIGHPSTFLKRINEIPLRRDIGAPFDKESLGEKALFIESTETIHLTENLILTGAIPRVVAFEAESLHGLLRENHDGFVPDDVADDKSLVIRIPGRGFFLVCGCCHAGMLNTIRHAASLSGETKLLGLAGGFHLIAYRDDTVQAAIEELEKWAPQTIVPLHCTGMKASAALWSAFGDRVQFLTTGDVLEI